MYDLDAVPRGEEVFLTLGNVIIDGDPRRSSGASAISQSAAGASSDRCPPGTTDTFKDGKLDAASWVNTNCNVLYPVANPSSEYAVGDVANYYPSYPLNMDVSYQFLDAKGAILYDNNLRFLSAGWLLGNYDASSGSSSGFNVVVNFVLPLKRRGSPKRRDD